MIVSHLTYHVPLIVSSVVSGVPAYLKIQQLSLCQTLKKKNNPTSHHVDILTSTSAGDDTTVSYKIILKHLEIYWLAARFSSVQLSSVAQSYQLFPTPETAAHQASLSFTISRNLLKLTSIESVMPSNHLILCHCPAPTSCLQSSPASGSFPMRHLFT